MNPETRPFDLYEEDQQHKLQDGDDADALLRTVVTGL